MKMQEVFDTKMRLTIWHATRSRVTEKYRITTSGRRLKDKIKNIKLIIIKKNKVITI